MRNLGMPLYGSQPPTGYSMTADAWVNTGALLNRMNFAIQLVDGGRVPPVQGRNGAPIEEGRGQGPGGRGGRGAQMRGPLQVNIAALVPDTSEQSRDALIAAMLAGQASAPTRQTLARAQNASHLLALTLGSPEFQRR
jgi:uncharacterized protein (DUF1800 family)